MTIAITQDEGSRTAGGGTITSITAGLLVCTTGLTSPAIGDIIEIFGSSTVANNSFFTVTAIVVANTQVQLSPAPANQGASGSARRLNRANVLYAALAPAAFSTVGATNLITGGGAQNFVTSGVRRGDRVIIAGGGQNQGAVYVRAVLSPTLLAIDTVGGAAWAVGAITTETVAVRAGLHRIVSTDEAALDWAEILTVATLVQGAGMVGDPTVLERRNVVTATVGQQRFRTILHGLSRLVLGQTSGALATVFTSVDEIVAPGKLPATGTGVVNNRIDAPTPSALSEVVFGSRKGQTDDLSFGEGACWWGFTTLISDVTAGRLKVSNYGSMVDPGDGVTFEFGNGNLLGMLYKGVFSGGGGTIRNVLLADKITAALIPTSGFVASQNVTIGSSAATGFLVGTASIGGLLLGAAVTLPLLVLAGVSSVNADNPGADRDITDFFTISGGSANGFKRYQFNPRYVTASPFGTTADPIENLLVEVWSLDGGEALIFSGLTNAAGRLNSGAGVTFIRQSIGAGDIVVDFIVRVIARGPGYRMSNRKFDLAQFITSDVGVQLLADNLENEVSSL